MSDIHDPTDIRTGAEYQTDLMLEGTHPPVVDAEAHEMRDQRLALGLVLAHGQELRDVVLRAGVPAEALGDARHRVAYQLAAALLAEELPAGPDNVADAIKALGVNGDFERPFLRGLAQAAQALLVAQGADKREVRRQFLRATGMLVDRHIDLRLHELRELGPALHRIAALKAEGDQ